MKGYFGKYKFTSTAATVLRYLSNSMCHDFHDTIIVAKRIHANEIIAIYRENFFLKCYQSDFNFIYCVFYLYFGK